MLMELFGGAGHSKEILKRLSPEGLLVGIDRDEEALKAAKENLKEFQNVKYVHGNNDEIEELLHILAVTGQTSYLRLPINNCEKTVSRTDYTLNKDCLNVLSAWCALYDDNRI